MKWTIHFHDGDGASFISGPDVAEDVEVVDLNAVLGFLRAHDMSLTAAAIEQEFRR